MSQDHESEFARNHGGFKVTNIPGMDRLNALLRDDGYLEDILLCPDSVDVPVLLALHGERSAAVISFSGLKEFGFIGGLSSGAIEHPELVDEGLRVFSVGVLSNDATEVTLVLSWEGDRSLFVRANSARIRFDSGEA
jgi:hypothetical protein